MKKKVYLRKEPAAIDYHGNILCVNENGIKCHFYVGDVCYGYDYPCFYPDIVYIKVKELKNE
jgi:hypothetical protein